jgi:hypothetical protein
MSNKDKDFKGELDFFQIREKKIKRSGPVFLLEKKF